jgi:type IV pilus assembly protein PilP
MTMRSTIAMGFALAAALSVTPGRAEDAAPAPAGIETAKAVEPAADPPYNPAGRRDPFLPPRVGPSIVSGATSPLQRYDVGQLRLVAVIYDTREPRAVVEDDQGLGYIVRLGTPIGTNGGAVTAIQRGKVIISEDTVDFYGEHRPVEVTMELRTAEQSN